MDAGSDFGGDWPAFPKRQGRVFGDVVRLELARGMKPTRGHDTKMSRLHARVVGLSIGDWTKPNAARLAKQLHK